MPFSQNKLENPYVNVQDDISTKQLWDQDGHRMDI